MTTRPKEISALYHQLKASAARRGIDFDLNILDLYDLTFPISCPALGIPLQFNRGAAADNSYSIDSINSQRGYTANNIVVVSNRVNRIKNNASLEELRRIVEYYTDLEKELIVDILSGDNHEI